MAKKGQKAPKPAPITRPKRTKPQGVAPKPKAEIPPILLEGDRSPAPPMSGPGSRYALSPLPPETQPPPPGPAELPEAYGTQRLLLTARDPHWLYAHWDLTRQQQKQFNARSADGHLVLRTYKDAIAGQPFNETHVHPESRNWFVHVGLGGTRFMAELGYYPRTGDWVRISTSKATLTPPDTLSEDLSVIFETLPAELQLSQLLAVVKSAVSTNVPLLEAIQQLRATGFPGLPEPEALQARRWSPEQDQALAQLITMDQVRRVWIGSLEITELLRRHLRQEIASLGASQFALPAGWSGEITSISSPFGAAPAPKSFWFNVNAELIIYGATEPDAQVTIGGRPIKLRPDGSFSFRFALPDGHYQLPAVATSADGSDQRQAVLSFERSTEYQGDVGQHPQDPQLKPPRTEDLA